MTDPDLQRNEPVDPAQASEPVVSKPYIMPDDPETGSAEAFGPARQLYASFGFTYCEPFAQYVDDPYSVFMTRRI